jgi:hypothetical protein
MLGVRHHARPLPMSHSVHFKEEFALVIPTGYPDGAVDWTTESYTPEFLAEVERVVAEATGSEDVTASQTSHGYGADAIAISVLLTTLSALFLSGNDVNESIERWIALGRRLASGVRTISQRYGAPRLSEPGAFAIALATISATEPDMPPVVLVSSGTAKVRNNSLDPRVFDLFRHHPDRYYVFTVEVAHRAAHVVAVASTGEVLFHHRLPLNFRQFPSSAADDA